jgi:hypothetical protein
VTERKRKVPLQTCGKHSNARNDPKIHQDAAPDCRANYGSKVLHQGESIRNEFDNYQENGIQERAKNKAKRVCEIIDANPNQVRARKSIEYRQKRPENGIRKRTQGKKSKYGTSNDRIVYRR